MTEFSQWNVGKVRSTSSWLEPRNFLDDAPWDLSSSLAARSRGIRGVVLEDCLELGGAIRRKEPWPLITAWKAAVEHLFELWRKQEIKSYCVKPPQFWSCVLQQLAFLTLTVTTERGIFVSSFSCWNVNDLVAWSFLTHTRNNNFLSSQRFVTVRLQLGLRDTRVLCGRILPLGPQAPFCWEKSHNR